VTSFSEAERRVDQLSGATFEGEVPAIGDAASAAPRAPSMLLPMTVGACFFMEGLDSTIIATSLPRIAAALGVTASQTGIALTAYLISVSMWMAASGWLADRFEARRVFVGAILVFMAGSAICGLSPNLYVLIAGRFLQGAGGALMTPVGRLILARAFPRNELVRAMGYMIIPGLLGPMFGPLVGGWITTHLDWRWIFFINLPLGLIGIGLALWQLPRHDATAQSRFDALGFVLVAATLVALQTGLEVLGSHRTLTPAAAIAIGVGLAGLALYIGHARRPEPILELRLFRYRTFAVAVLGGSFSRLVLGATMFLFPLYFQLALGFSPVEAGTLMAVLAGGQIALRLGLDPLLKKLGIRRLLMVNSLAMAVMLCVLLVLRTGTPLIAACLFTFLFGLVHSIQLSLLSSLNFSGLPAEELGRATSLGAVVQRLAMAFGISLTAILLAFTAQGGTPDRQAFVAPTLVLALMMVASVLSFTRLREGDGADLLAKA
jgi:EmrB/QacA subfamily drug resistance transporter